MSKNTRELILKKLDGDRSVHVPNVQRYKQGYFKGKEIFPQLPANILLVGASGSGKTIVLNEIIRRITNEEDKTFIFSKNHNKCETWSQCIKPYYEQNDLNYFITTDFLQKGPDGKMTNYLEIIDDLSSVEGKPDYMNIIIIDDLSSKLGNSRLTDLLKDSSHLNATVIILDQVFNKLSTDGRRQMHYIILFQGLGPSKLKEIYDLLGLSIDLPKFIQVYKLATFQKYNFLYIQKVPELKFLKNFDTEIQGWKSN